MPDCPVSILERPMIFDRMEFQATHPARDLPGSQKIRRRALCLLRDKPNRPFDFRMSALSRYNFLCLPIKLGSIKSPCLTNCDGDYSDAATRQSPQEQSISTPKPSPRISEQIRET
jgi:hypothetical protein